MMLKGAEVKDVLQIAVFSMAIMSGAFMVWTKIQQVPALAAEVDEAKRDIVVLKTKVDFIVAGMEKITRTKFKGE